MSIMASQNIYQMKISKSGQGPKEHSTSNTGESLRIVPVRRLCYTIQSKILRI